MHGYTFYVKSVIYFFTYKNDAFIFWLSYTVYKGSQIVDMYEARNPLECVIGHVTFYQQHIVLPSFTDKFIMKLDFDNQGL